MVYDPAGVSPFGFVGATADEALENSQEINLSDQVIFYREKDISEGETIVSAPEGRASATLNSSKTTTRTFSVLINQQEDTQLQPGSYTVRHYQEFLLPNRSSSNSSGMGLQQVILEITFDIINGK